MIAYALLNALALGVGNAASSGVAGRAWIGAVLLARITNVPEKIYDIVEGRLVTRFGR